LDSSSRLVWDLPVRITHWLLVLTVVGAWITDKLGPAYFIWHVVCGCTVLVLVAFRVIWGFAGTRYARFSSFIRRPRTILRHLRGKASNSDPEGTIGHNPLGALSVVLLLGLLLAQAVTGLFSNDEIASVGPFYGWITGSQSKWLTSLHHRVFVYLELLILLHVTAVLFYTFVKRVRLIGPMFTGLKPADLVPAGSEISSSRLWMAILIVSVLLGVLLALIYSAPPATLSPF
jgi:cytochrome b